MNPRSVARVVAGAIAAPLLSFMAVALLREEHSGQATIAGMVNIAYAIALAEHLALLAVVYGLVVPTIAPRLATRAMPSMSIGLCIGAASFAWMLFRLGLFQLPNIDHFAVIAMRNTAIGMMLDVLLIYWLGFKSIDLK